MPTLSRRYVFVLVVFGISWTIWLGLLAGARLGLIAGDAPLRHYAWGGLAPSLVAMLLTYRLSGWSGVRRLVARAREWRVPWRWYAFALLTPFGIRLLGIALHATTGGQARFPEIDVAKLAAWFLVGLIVGLMEEFGWRGFLQPELRSQGGAVWTGTWVGIAWWAWHLPLFWIEGTSLHEWQARSNLPVAMAAYAGAVIGLSMLFTLLYERTGGSLLLAFLLHSATNASADLFSGPYRAVQEMGPTWWNVIVLLVAATLVTWSLRRAGRGTGGTPQAPERRTV